MRRLLWAALSVSGLAVVGSLIMWFAQVGPAASFGRVARQLEGILAPVGGKIDCACGELRCPCDSAGADLFFLSLGKGGDHELKAMATLALPRLRLVEAIGSGISHKGVQTLATWPTIESLNLDLTRVRGAGFESIIHLRSLRWLCLSNTDITNDEVAIVSKIKSLRHLDLVRTGANDRCVVHLLRMRLDKLILSRQSFSEEAVTALTNGMPNTEIHWD